MSKNSAKIMLGGDKYELLVAEEELILHAQMLIQRVLKARKLSQKQLAERLGVGESYISQMLGCSARNLTLRTVARVLKVLDASAILTLDDEAHQHAVADDVQVVERNAVAHEQSKMPLTSDAWGAIVDLKPRGRGRKKSGKAEAFAAYDPPCHELALAA
ncbi:XRE family transcriptional regulator [Novosphingobium sp. FGD1]|uniref:XRE family transcriptional regulator n=1 Tax=Novosphingobium silvae TaxID=2692619 RepID=A0A7X4K8B9_9SPHN|nr:helix-turn-helix transcriptional regulator [Novosphingobium silvae]MYL98917.1 XRE family transcriptional regulator [Novosphingobium silvae]